MDRKVIITQSVDSLGCYIFQIESFLQQIKPIIDGDYTVYFRGEPQDFGNTAFQPSIYRKKSLINKEDVLYQEMRRFNDLDFNEDKTTFDRLSRMQHYFLPTRLVDMTEDPLAALWFAVSEKEKKQEPKESFHPYVYMVVIKNENIRYFDSDTVTVISNLAKIPPDGKYKSKDQILQNIKMYYQPRFELEDRPLHNFNKEPGISYLLHEIRNDAGHFEPIIQPRHLVSVQCVKPKLTSSRIHSQKGAFLLFGLNYDDVNKCIPIIEKDDKGTLIMHHMEDNKVPNWHPVIEIFKIKIGDGINTGLLERFGTRQPYIYPEMDKISEYFKDRFSHP